MTQPDDQEPTGASHRGLVRHSYSYFSAHVSPDGTLVHSGPKRGEGYSYTAPDGAVYQRNWSYHEDGSPTGIIGHGMTGVVVDGKRVSTLTVINRANRTYSEQRTEHSVTGAETGPKSPILDLESSPSEVREAIQNGQLIEKGTTTVEGTPAIAFSITVPLRMPDAHTIHRTLYVDTRIDQTLRMVTVVDGPQHRPYIADWMPATPDNIAKARDDSPIPAGYTKVDWAG